MTAIAADGLFNLVLKSDGTVVGWGNNGSGQLNIPAGLANVIAISTGVTPSVALQSDGTVAVWSDTSARFRL